MRTAVTAYVAKVGHAYQRHAPKRETQVTYKKRKLPIQFSQVELQEARELEEWVNQEMRNVLGG